MSDIVSLLAEAGALLLALVIGLAVLALIIVGSIVIFAAVSVIHDELADATPESVKAALAAIVLLAFLGFLLVLSFGVGEAIIQWASGVIT